ncbi:hypothetical protein JZ751_025479 [Albula glossodonta]|uniref:Uncharacterized protein n=1 Tax=Albula glossodonta TaxID=121402 RepID=A0A8T2NI64_9TELE|nr:hypothetical protein JZ751_025479 [Albula glossodonta]
MHSRPHSLKGKGDRNGHPSLRYDTAVIHCDSSTSSPALQILSHSAVAPTPFHTSCRTVVHSALLSTSLPVCVMTFSHSHL